MLLMVQLTWPPECEIMDEPRFFQMLEALEAGKGLRHSGWHTELTLRYQCGQLLLKILNLLMRRINSLFKCNYVALLRNIK